MEFINISKKHSLVGSVVHGVLNLLLVLSVWYSIYITKFPYLGIYLVLISKWRTFAVRPRYWAVNIKSNLVDLIFSVGMTLLMWTTMNIFFVQLALILLYGAWLTAIKPLSSEKMMKTQAILAVFIGLSALFSVSYGWWDLTVVIVAFIIGYAVFRHVLSFESCENIDTLSLFWGLIFAEMAWVFNFLVIGYSLFGFESLKIPQASIIMTLLSFLSFEFLSIWRNKEKTMRELISPSLFVLGILVILLFFFSSIPSSVSY